MDAYIFACNASSGAQTAAVGEVGDAARVALPTTGGRELYVAVSGSTALELTTNVATILQITGMGGTETYIPNGLGSPPLFLFPTYAAVDSWIGLGIVVCSSQDMNSVHDDIAQITGVVGLSLITGAGALVLAEVTASSEAGVGTMLDNVEAVTGVDAMARAVGQRSNGAGFTAI